MQAYSIWFPTFHFSKAEVFPLLYTLSVRVAFNYAHWFFYSFFLGWNLQQLTIFRGSNSTDFDSRLQQGRQIILSWIVLYLTYSKTFPSSYTLIKSKVEKGSLCCSIKSLEPKNQWLLWHWFRNNSKKLLASWSSPCYYVFI